MKIRDIFDESRKIDRRIEKVVTYANKDNDLLKNEVSEYIVTKNIEDSLEKMLDVLDASGTGSKSGETCFWVSGFYGSGKSSLTKYLGFALDPSVEINGTRFLDLFNHRINNPIVSARLSAVAKKNPMAIVMLDLATQHIDQNVSGISDILFWHVMRWAGYSKDMKIACLEKLIEQENKTAAFEKGIIKISKGKPWSEVKDTILVAKTFASKMACELFPQIWPTEKAFNDIRIEEVIPAHDRVKEMLSLVQKRAGTKGVLFILDEVGQYVAPRDNLIMDLDGLAKSIKELGGGNAYLMATAQQTLTENNPQVQINTGNLFKLKDRFPVSIELREDDIRTITHLRLLSKSTDGEQELKTLFAAHGAEMRNVTQLANLKQFTSIVTEKEFCDFYPFLPQHFSILRTLIIRLSKTSGGIGLRSSLKVVQDILVEKLYATGKETAFVDKSLGSLVTAETFYDALRSDIKTSFRHLGEAVDKVEQIWGVGSIQHRVSKAITILQLVTEVAVTAENIAAMLVEDVKNKSLLSEVKVAIAEIQNNHDVALNELDGSLRFMSEVVNELDKKKLEIQPRQNDIRSAYLEVLKDLFKSLPSATVFNAKKIETGIEFENAPYNGTVIDGKEIVTEIELVDNAQLAKRREDLLKLSTSPSKKNTIFWLVEKVSIDAELIEMVQCNQIYDTNHAKERDKEILEYLSSQKQRARALAQSIEKKLRDTLKNGTFIFRMQPQTISGPDAVVALQHYLAEKGKEIYGRFIEAPHPGEAKLAEHFLSTQKIENIRSEHDPLGLVEKNQHTAKIDLNHAAIISIKDYLSDQGRQEGRQILEHFSRPPFGWSPDTTRYVIAAMFVGSLIAVNQAGEELTVRGPKVIDALKNPSNFKRVSISLRENRPSPEALKRAAERLVQLTGEPVMPLDDEISSVVKKNFPDLQRAYGSHETKLESLGLPGADRARNVQDGIANILKADASQAYAILGPENCELFENLIWSRDLQKSIDNHIDDLIQEVQDHIHGIAQLPNVGKINELKSSVSSLVSDLQAFLKRESFFEKKADISAKLAELKTAVAGSAEVYARKETEIFENAVNRLQSGAKYQIISSDSKQFISSLLDSIKFEAARDLKGIQQTSRMSAEASSVLKQAEEIIENEIRQKLEDQAVTETAQGGGEAMNYQLVNAREWPSEINSEKELDAFVAQIEALRLQLKQNIPIRIIF